MGCKSFVSIHTRPTVPRDPPPGVYRGVRDARKALIPFKGIGVGKGLTSLRGTP